MPITGSREDGWLVHDPWNMLYIGGGEEICEAERFKGSVEGDVADRLRFGDRSSVCILFHPLQI